MVFYVDNELTYGRLDFTRIHETSNFGTPLLLIHQISRVGLNSTFFKRVELVELNVFGKLFVKTERVA